MKNNDYIVCIGASMTDIIIDQKIGQSGKIKVYSGGTGRNMGELIARLGYPVKLLSVVANDVFGERLINDSKITGVDTSYVKTVRGADTAKYICLLNGDGDLDYRLDFAMAVSIDTIASEFAVNDKITLSGIEKDLKKFNFNI